MNRQQLRDALLQTLDDDRLTARLLAAQQRGVRLRLITDDDKSWDRGSDVRRLADRGVPVRMDRSPHHFHHKFAVFDRARLVNGSYNWTRGADRDNRENFMLSEESGLVARYQRAFDALWAELS